MHNSMWAVILLPMVVGCASTPPVVTHPMPADEVGWSSVTEPPVPPPHPKPLRRPAGTAEQVVPYQEGTPVKVAVGVHTGLTLQFEADEAGLSVMGAYRGLKPADDPEDPWVVQVVEHGAKYPLVYLTVTRPGLTTGFTISTNKRLYLIDARSVQISKYRLVRWTTPAIDAAEAPPPLPYPLTKTLYHAGYTMTTTAHSWPTWTPQRTVDNGRKTFVTFPLNLSVMSAPMVRLIGANGPELVNPTLIDHVLVLDHLIPVSLELRLGSGETAEVVTITRGAPITLTCPGDAECPVWSPTVAQRLLAR